MCKFGGWPLRISKGADVVTTSKMLGHSQVSTTEDIYARLIEESRQQASNALVEGYFKKSRTAN